MRFRMYHWWTLLLALGVLQGCGKPEPFDIVPVSGTVTYADGSLIEADFISVNFLPLTPAINAKTHPRPAEAQVNVKDGTFENATTREFADGITAGKHKVLIEAFDANMNRLPVIPPQYAEAATTPLEVDSNDSPFHFQIEN